MTTATAPEEVQTSDVSEQTNELNIHDRCDQCGSQAYVRIYMSAGSELSFCGHDYSHHESLLTPLSTRTVDERYKLYATTKLDVSA